MAIEKSDKFVIIRHPSGASAKILKYGATVIDWTFANGTKALFLSDAAKLDGSKAIRGGIPLVFPVFGKSSHHPTASLPQHGFARISTWRLTGESENSATFTLTQDDLDPAARTLWDSEFRLMYTVALGESELTTEYEVYNPGTKGFECHMLLHTYLRVQDVSEIGIEGLHGLHYKDKVADKDDIEDSQAVKITGAIDRVYQAAPPETKVVVNNKVLFTLDTDNFKDIVVWNPYIEGAASMGDFEPKAGWKNMVLNPTGLLSNDGFAWKPEMLLVGCKFHLGVRRKVSK